MTATVFMQADVGEVFCPLNWCQIISSMGNILEHKVEQKYCLRHMSLSWLFLLLLLQFVSLAGKQTSYLKLFFFFLNKKLAPAASFMPNVSLK